MKKSDGMDTPTIYLEYRGVAYDVPIELVEGLMYSTWLQDQARRRIRGDHPGECEGHSGDSQTRPSEHDANGTPR